MTRSEWIKLLGNIEKQQIH